MIRRLREHLRPLSDEFQIGVNGNVYACKQGKRPGLTLMIAAHMDEVGCVVRDIDPSGMIRFHKVGNFGDSWLAGARVRIKEIPGVIGIKSAHLMSDEEKRTALPHHSLYIDVGARNADEAEAMGIGIGDPIAFDVTFERFHNRDYLCGKALDNRVACAVLVALMERLSDGDFPGTVWAVGTVQEERGLAGARTATHYHEARLVHCAGYCPGDGWAGESSKLQAGPAGGRRCRRPRRLWGNLQARLLCPP